jgi:hypothetical protein
MFGSPRTKFNIADAMDRGLCVVIDNAQSKLDEDGCSFLGRFFVSRIWSAATARANRLQSAKKAVYVYIDEAQLVIDPMIAKIIDECRSQKIGIVLANQRASQIEDPNVRGALENCAIKMVNVGHGEITYFSKLLDIPIERMKNLPRGHFATDIRWEGTSIMSVPKAQLPFRTMTPDEERTLQLRMKKLYGVETPNDEKKIIVYEDGSKLFAKMQEGLPPRLFPDAQTAPERAVAVDAQIHGQEQHPVAIEANKPIAAPEKNSDPSKPSKWTRG